MPRPRLYEHKRIEIFKLAAEGKSVRVIAKETGVPKSTVDRMLKRKD